MEREKRNEKRRKERRRERQNVDAMPITKVKGVGLGGGDSEGESRRWRRRSGGLTLGRLTGVVGHIKLSLDFLLTTDMQV